MIDRLINNAQRSPIHRWLLNKILQYKIPFNRPHQPEILKVEADVITMRLPFIRKNKNHINSMHACALATMSEYISGISLARCLGTEKYRFILKELKMVYSYQAKEDVFTSFRLPVKWINDEVITPLLTDEAVTRELKVELFDSQNKLICTGFPVWQIKRWETVKTKV